MSRSKAKGTRLETAVAAYLREHVDDRIERRTTSGTKDRGDISGLRHMGQRIVVECKNTSRADLAGWAAEADAERRNDDANAALIVHKRVGRSLERGIGDQWVTCTLDELIALINGNRDHVEAP